ncbi:MAG: single-stranded-DNA-specific exonuclease RecJ [Acidobacteria bacterium]|nr:single-stranded-DNA-specific exonuclease RecJ [Acidobacteriota bacterium]
MVEARWLVPDSPAGTGDLAGALGLHGLAARVLWHRGYRDPEPARQFLAPAIDDLHDPFLLKDIGSAVERLKGAITRGEKILLYGDYDVDGTTSVVILKKALDLAGAVTCFHVPHRLRDGYGMRADVIERAAAEGVRVIVSVDTGIRAAAVVERAGALQIDVIVTDHHLPEAELPPALAVINPNRVDCPYPEKNLCGAGVTLKLVQALLLGLEWPREKVARLLASFLKMVALATVADVVPLTGENRVIVKLGLEGFDRVRNPGLRALLRVAGFRAGERPTAGQVAFRIAPRINAAGRMASAEDVIGLFLTEDDARAAQIASQLHDLNKDRQDTEAEILRLILEECERRPVSPDQFALVFSGQSWHRGVVGIVASRIVERFHRPTFVLSEDEESGEAHGSGRSIAAFHLLEALESMPGLFTKFGGHRQAAGVTLPAGSVEEFRARLNDYAARRLSPEDLRSVFEIDAELALGEINERSVADVLRLAPFGFSNPAPLFLVSDAEVCGPPQPWNEKHLRVALRQNGRTVIAKAWNFAGRASALEAGGRIDAVVCLDEDAFAASSGLPGWNLVLKDFRPARAAAAAGAASIARPA